MNLCASQTRPYEDLRLKTKFGLVNVISHIWQKGKEGERPHILVERRRERFVISSPCNQGTSLSRRMKKKKGKRI